MDAEHFRNRTERQRSRAENRHNSDAKRTLSEAAERKTKEAINRNTSRLVARILSAKRILATDTITAEQRGKIEELLANYVRTASKWGLDI